MLILVCYMQAWKGVSIARWRCCFVEACVDRDPYLLAGGGEDNSGCSQRPELPQLWSLEEAERLPLATLAAKGYPLLHVVQDPYPFQS